PAKDPEAPPRDCRRFRSKFRAAGRARAGPVREARREIAVKRGATPAQVALAWLIRKPNVGASPGASSVKQVEENVAAADVELTDDEAERLSSLAPVG